MHHRPNLSFGSAKIRILFRNPFSLGLFFLLPHLFLYPLLQMGLCWSFEPDTHVRSAVVVELNVDFSERAG